MAWFLHCLTLIFVAAKIFEQITWSWWLVLAPSIACIGLGVFLVLCAVVVSIIALYSGLKE